MATPGRLAKVMVAGEPVTMTNEATTANAERTIYQVTNPARRCWSDAPVTVQRSTDNGETWSTVPATQYTLDRLFGRVIFAAAQSAGTQVRVSGEYLPLTVVAGAYAYSYTITANLQERAAFDDPDDFMRRRQVGLDASGSISRWYDADPLFAEAIEDEEPVILEFWSDKTGLAADVRIRALVSQEGVNGEAAALLEEEVEFQGVADVDGRALSFA